MPDCFSPEKRSEVMRRVRQRDTRPELLLRGALWRDGIRYRKHHRIAGIRVDLAVTARRLAVFVDGCFWHGCPAHYTEPDSNASFWREKIRVNRRRDAANDEDLMELGWDVLRVWECEIEADLKSVVGRIREALIRKEAHRKRRGERWKRRSL